MGRRPRAPLNLPGPAHYVYDDRVLRTGRHLGIHHSIAGRLELPRDDVPGPGRYDPQPLFSSPSFTIQPRPKSLKNRLKPGPTDYIIPAFILRTGKSMSAKHSIQSKRELSIKDIPGPADYAPNDGYKPQVASITNPAKEPKPPVGPTATSYDIKPNMLKNGLQKAETHVLGLRRPVPENTVPPPGYYNPKYPPDQRSITFQRQGRLDFPYNENPGPGAYQLPSAQMKPVYMGQRLPWKPKSGVGPAHYSYPADLTRSGKSKVFHTMIHQRIKSVPHMKAPSPTRYDIEAAIRRTKKGQPQFTMQCRRESETDSNPPPGTYNICSTDPNNSFCYKPGPSARDSHIPRHKNPSPTKYTIEKSTIDRTAKKAPSYTIAGPSDCKPRQETPGPGAYIDDLNKYGVGGKGLAKVFSIGSRTKVPDYRCSPGPACYNADPMIGRTIRSTKPSLPQYSMGQKIETVEMDCVWPGPGEYNVVDFKKSGSGWVRTGPN